MNTFVSALLVGLVSVFCMLDSRLLGRLNFEQPLVGATLVGVVLGDPMTGLAVGAAAERVGVDADDAAAVLLAERHALDAGKAVPQHGMSQTFRLDYQIFHATITFCAAWQTGRRL